MSLTRFSSSTGEACLFTLFVDWEAAQSLGLMFLLLFLSRAPDTARIKAKMMYASTKDFFKGYLDGLSIELQGSDLDDISEQEASSAVRSSVTRQ